MTPTAVPIPAVLPAIPAITPWPSIINVSSPPRRCRAPAPLPSDWRTVTPAPPHPHTTKAYPKPHTHTKVETPASSLSRLSLSLSKHTTKNSTPRKTKTRTPTREEGKGRRECAELRANGASARLEGCNASFQTVQILRTPSSNGSDLWSGSEFHTSRSAPASRRRELRAHSRIPEWVPSVLLFPLYPEYLTLRSVSSLNNPKNGEMKFSENMKLACWKSSS